MHDNFHDADPTAPAPASSAVSASDSTAVSSVKPEDPQLSALTRQQVVAEKQAAILEAQRKLLKGKLGEIPASGIDSKATVADPAGAMETALLAHAALGPIADKLTIAVTGLGEKCKHVIIYPGPIPELKELAAFSAFSSASNAAFSAALRIADATDGREGAGLLAGVGIALSSLSNVLGYFRSEFSFRGTETKIEDMSFVKLLAGKLRAENPQLDITIASLHQGFVPDIYPRFVQDNLESLFELRQRAATRLAQHANAAPAATANPAVARLAAVTQSFDSAMETLGAGDSLRVLASQYAIAQQWKAAHTTLLQVSVEKAGGSSYDQKNLWTLFGVMPYKLMGAAIVSYALIDGPSGKLLGSDVLSSHGGFRRPSAIAAMFKSAPAA
jgi:hypothetical protein